VKKKPTTRRGKSAKKKSAGRPQASERFATGDAVVIWCDDSEPITRENLAQLEAEAELKALELGGFQKREAALHGMSESGRKRAVAAASAIAREQFAGMMTVLSYLGAPEQEIILGFLESTALVAGSRNLPKQLEAYCQSQRLAQAVSNSLIDTSSGVLRQAKNKFGERQKLTAVVKRVAAENRVAESRVWKAIREAGKPSDNFIRSRC